MHDVADEPRPAWKWSLAVMPRAKLRAAQFPGALDAAEAICA